MKILDRYILTSYLKTFFSVFIILILIFILQTIWLYIKELAGKDLDLIVIFKFLFYIMPKLIPLVLPLTILLASIMVFGNFAENYEFAAMKSTGISLQRAMSGLSVFIVILGITTFFFSNNVIPWAEFNSYNLRKNIAKLKPAMLLAEGQFNSVGNYNIKFANKKGDRDQYLEDVTIHIKGNNGRKNATVIKSRIGELASEENSNVLKLILSDGHYYSDVYSKDRATRKKNPFAKSTFEKKIINIDLSKINNVDFDEKTQTDKYSMLDVKGLHKTIDSLVIKYDTEHKTFSKNLITRSGINLSSVPIIKDSTKIKPREESFLNVLNTKKQLTLVDLALKSLKNSRQFIENEGIKIKYSKSWLSRHYISLHEKFALGFACIILFFVGAPLGALIRKGGLGLPMVVAILLFLTYHFIGIFATNSAKNGGFNPVLAPWFSTLIMLPLGIILTKKATEDRSLFEFGNSLEPLINLFKTKSKPNYAFLKNYTNERLIKITKDYKTLKHREDIKNKAIDILCERELSIANLERQGLVIRKRFFKAKRIQKEYRIHAVFSLVLYLSSLFLLGLYFILNNNGLSALSDSSVQLSVVAFALFIIYYIKSIINIHHFYNTSGIKSKGPGIPLLAIGFFFYGFVFLILKENIKKDLRETL